MYKNTLFDCFGFTYLGPIDGHNIDELENAFECAKKVNSPVLVHVVTKKGKGYQPAEDNPGGFHGIGRFDIDSGEPLSSHKGFSAEFGKTMCELAEDDKKICAITAAMSGGTGLTEFSRLFKERFFDVGIAEEHAVTFGCGLAAKGMRPVFAVYSTFLQRSADQLIHDGALQRRKLIIAVDRAGFVGEDGETHQGLFDVPLLQSLPNTTVYSPATYEEINSALYSAFYKDSGLIVIRYPRGSEPEEAKGLPVPDEVDLFGDSAADTAIVTYGRLFFNALRAQEILAERGVNVKIVKLARIKPLPERTFEFLDGCKIIFFFEEGMKGGGVGERLGRQLEKYSLSAEGMTAVIEKQVKR